MRFLLLNKAILIHRDYSFSGSILVSIFDDRIEIASLGGLVPGLSIDDIMLGISQSRNEKLSGIFYRLRHVESYGTGIGKIRKDYEGMGILPDFKVTNGAFLLVFYNKNYFRGKMDIQDNISSISIDDELENSILKFMISNGSITRKIIEDKFGVKQTKAGLILKKMETKNYIKKVGSGKNTRYYKIDLK